MIVSPRSFRDPSSVKEWILRCENSFVSSMQNCVSRLGASSCQAILLSGPSCSGKTTATSLIASYYREQGRKLYTVSVDDFYRSREALQGEGEAEVLPDYESFAALDGETLYDCVTKIFADQEAALPRFNFELGDRSHTVPYRKRPDETVLFEGIHTIYPEFRQMMQNLSIPYLFVYIRPAEEVQYEDVSFSPMELRFMRRIVRDLRTRGASPSFTSFLWEGVVKNEQQNMVPYQNLADITINTTLGYEPFMIKDRFLAAEQQIPSDSAQKAFAARLAEKLRKIPSITDEFLPKESIFREFIG